MVTEKEVSMMAEIMDSILQTDEWMEMQLNDPGIKAADSVFEQALDKAKGYIPHDLYVELSDTRCGVIAAYADAAVLYGMNVITTIQRVAANPHELSRFWLQRAQNIE